MDSIVIGILDPCIILKTSHFCLVGWTVGGCYTKNKPRWWFQTFFIFTLVPGEMIQFDEHIFQMGWFNHQLETLTQKNATFYESKSTRQKSHHPPQFLRVSEGQFLEVEQ